MNVEKIDYVILPPPIIEYYKLKEKHTKKNLCPICHKHPLIFLEKNRILSSTCKTIDCKANMKFFLDKVITYDEAYSSTKQNYIKSTDLVLKEKFDIIFNYKKASDISELKDEYINSKTNYENLYTLHYNKVDQKETELKDAINHKHEYIIALKESIQNGNGVPPGIPDDLNSVLNKIHKATYTTLLRETILTPEFDIGITIL